MQRGECLHAMTIPIHIARGDGIESRALPRDHVALRDGVVRVRPSLRAVGGSVFSQDIEAIADTDQYNSVCRTAGPLIECV
jgi:hypothetical protein